jgi:hypothetical protein
MTRSREASGSKKEIEEERGRGTPLVSCGSSPDKLVYIHMTNIVDYNLVNTWKIKEPNSELGVTFHLS